MKIPQIYRIPTEYQAWLKTQKIIELSIYLFIGNQSWVIRDEVGRLFLGLAWIDAPSESTWPIWGQIKLDDGIILLKLMCQSNESQFIDKPAFLW